jgi:arylsulfatase A-like enzyme
MKRNSIITIGISAVVSSAAFILSAKAEKAKPNIIFILLDDYGYTDLGCYGSKFYETPFIDRLAKQGIRFTDAYAACPVSSPTRAAIMTGRYPTNTGITDWIPGRQASNTGTPDDKLVALPFKLQLDLEEVTIAEVLKKNGYKTMISGKWHLGGEEKYWPENQGFDINKGGFNAGSPIRNKTANGYFSPYGNPRLEDGPVGEYLTDRQTDEAITFIKNNQDKPFFVYLPYYAVHNPMQGKEDLVKRFSQKADSMGLSKIQPFTRDKAWIKRSMSDNYKERVIQSNPVYAAMIWSVDENIGKLLKALSDLKLDDNTIIIFTSDNGGLATSEGSPTCNAPLRAGKGWLYEGGIRVPLIIRLPGNKNSGREISSPVSSIDYFRTICEMTGTDPGSSPQDGVSFFPLLKNKKIAERPLFWHYPHYSNQGTMPGSAVRLGNFKLIDNFETGKQELYDLSKDLSETTDISASNPEKTKELFDLLNKWRKTTNAKPMEPNPKWNGL